MNEQEEEIKYREASDNEKATDQKMGAARNGHEQIAGYPIKEIAKAPVKPPDPYKQDNKKPRELINEATQNNSHAPKKNNKIFVSSGIIFIISGLALGLFFDIYITMTLLIIGLVLTFIGTFIKL